MWNFETSFIFQTCAQFCLFCECCCTVTVKFLLKVEGTHICSAVAGEGIDIAQKQTQRTLQTAQKLGHGQILTEPHRSEFKYK